MYSIRMGVGPKDCNFCGRVMSSFLPKWFFTPAALIRIETQILLTESLQTFQVKLITYFKLCILCFQGQLNSWLEVNMRTITATRACAVWSELAGKDQRRESDLQEIYCVDLELFWRNLSHKLCALHLNIGSVTYSISCLHPNQIWPFSKGQKKETIVGISTRKLSFSPSENGPFQQKINHPHYRRRLRLVHLLKHVNTAWTKGVQFC